MPATFDDDECYHLFLVVDSRVRASEKPSAEIEALRERLLPFYAAWHRANTNKVHPSAKER